MIIPFSALSYFLIEKPGVAFGEKLWRRLEKKRPLPDKQEATSVNFECVKLGAVERELVKR